MIVTYVYEQQKHVYVGFFSVFKNWFLFVFELIFFDQFLFTINLSVNSSFCFVIYVKFHIYITISIMVLNIYIFIKSRRFETVDFVLELVD